MYRDLMRKGVATKEALERAINNRDKSYDSQLHFHYYKMLKHLSKLQREHEREEITNEYVEKNMVEIFNFLAEFWHEVALKTDEEKSSGGKGFRDTLFDKARNYNREIEEENLLNPNKVKN
jgi:hypothetical protein